MSYEIRRERAINSHNGMWYVYLLETAYYVSSDIELVEFSAWTKPSIYFETYEAAEAAAIAAQIKGLIR